MFLLILSLLAATPDGNAASDKDPMVCKAIERTGSRLAPRKVCKPESEWRLLTQGARRDLSDIQRRAAPESIPSF